MMPATEGEEGTNSASKNEEPQEHLTDVVSPPLRWKEGECPETDAWWWSRLIFYWMTPLFRRAAYLKKKDEALEQDDLLPVPEFDHSSRIGPAFEKTWDKQLKKEAEKKTVSEASPEAAPVKGIAEAKDNIQSTERVRVALMAVFGRSFYVAGVIKFCNTMLQFSFPLLLNAILKYIEDTQSGAIGADSPGGVRYRGYWLSALLFFAMVVKALAENAYFHRVYRCGYQARIALSVAVYNKSLRLANAERQSTTLGELVNLMQIDSTKVEMFIPQVHTLWDGALQIVGYMAILYTLIGWPAFAGLLLMTAAGPVQGIIMKKLYGLNSKMVKYTDQRVKTTNEALQGIQAVKMYTWEESFEKNIEKSRNEELSFLARVANLRGFSRAYMTALPGVVAVLSFVVFALATVDPSITASTLFAALVAFDQLRFPLLFYPMALAQLAQARVSAGRVETFLNMKEIVEGETSGNGIYSREEDGHGEIVVKDATIFWNDPALPIGEISTDDAGSSAAFTIGSSAHSTKQESEHALKKADSETPAVKYSKPILKNVTFDVAPGELCAVVGRVASGKSSLCSAILNETILEQGEIVLKGKVAYAAQSPWILNASVRDNILFGMPMDEEKYERVIHACQLTYDLEMLEDGDLTPIGERGITMSGGQKARVSVARAAYSDADTIILDDPLSALDPEVGKRMLEDCIVDLMRGKTRLLVTNQLQFLRYCDKIVALGSGKVVEQGAFTELMSREDGEVKRIVEASTYGQNEKDQKKTTDNVLGEPAKQGHRKSSIMAPKDAKELLTKEERNIGAVSWSVYNKYLEAGGGFVKFSVVFCAFILCAGNSLASSTWVSVWTSDSKYIRHSQGFYLGIYGMFAVTLGLFTFVRTVLLVRLGVRASAVLHKNLLDSILRAPQSFFDTTPVGRILSRFSKDFYSIDVELSDQLDMFLFCVLTVLVSLGTITFVTPWFGIAVVPLGYLYFKFLNYFRNVSRETKRLESVSRSPVYGQFSETLGGLTTIRAYGQATRFQYSFDTKIDANIRAWYCNKYADRWLSVRLEFIGGCIAGLAGVFATSVTLSSGATGAGSTNNFASLAGLSLTFAISMTGLLNWCVRTFAQLEASMNSVERVLYYTEQIPQEAPRTSAELVAHAASTNSSISNPSAFAVDACGGKAADMPPSWPDKGSIILKNLRMRYRSDTPLVLKGLNVSIAGGERIGVVGRTGSGKSSLLLTLLRLVEPALEDDADMEHYEPPLLIDGVDALRVGVRELRSKLGIIPQNPALFSGTVKSNVDPFSEYSDEQIWAALERCGMRGKVEEMPGMLDATIAEYGENLSAGMRQMLVLGRALLRQCRILLLDEATSSVDYETDKEIQRTIREAFPGCTVLTIAHRINTIMDSDKILVMKDGLAEEFASPQELLQDENSTFSEIVRQAKTGKD